MSTVDGDRERAHNLIDAWFDSLAEDAGDRECVMEEAMVVGIFALPQEDGVGERTLMRCTSSGRYVQEGILRSAQREHDINMMAGRLDSPPPDEPDDPYPTFGGE